MSETVTTVNVTITTRSRANIRSVSQIRDERSAKLDPVPTEEITWTLSDSDSRSVLTKAIEMLNARIGV